jgi:hypothetical protein
MVAEAAIVAVEVHGPKWLWVARGVTLLDIVWVKCGKPWFGHDLSIPLMIAD